MLVAVIDWTNVLLALIAAVPGIVAAVYAGRVHSQVKTPSGKTIGAQVEDGLHTAISNNHYAVAISESVGAKPSPQADGEAQKVSGITAPVDHD